METANSLPAGNHGICPWWMAYFFDNPLRRMIHPPQKLLAPYVGSGMTVLDFGCGFGHFSLGMARLVGETGRVYAVDVQQKMLDKTMDRAQRANLAPIIRPVLADGRGIGVRESLDFALLSNCLHETPDPAFVLSQLFSCLVPGGSVLLMEPRGHMKAGEFTGEKSLARNAGFRETKSPKILREMCVLLEKPLPRVNT